MSIGPGLFVPVVGPSGAGKDAIMGFARGIVAGDPRIVFARRVITRPARPDAEDHDTLSEAAFLDARARGAFALSWTSHGLHYAIPAEFDDVIRAGGMVIANISRASVAEARLRYANVMPVLITVPADMLAQRLAARGRETAADIAARLARNAEYDMAQHDCYVIENSGTLESAGNTFVRFITMVSGFSNQTASN